MSAQRLRRVLGGFALASGGGVCLWLLCLGMVWTPLLFAGFAGVAASLWQSPRRNARTIALVVLVAIALSAHRVPLHEFAASMARMSARIARSGADGLRLHERPAVYLLNFAMAGGGYAAGLPEVAWETRALATTAPEPTRRRQSDFAMRSPKIRRVIADALRALASTKSDAETRTVAWTGYFDPAESPRVALALNTPAKVTVNTYREREVAVCVQARIEYPRSARLTFGTDSRGRALFIDEGIFWALQQKGWLHPYTVEWCWTMPQDDPRLRELDIPVHSRRERLLLRLLGR